jgi:hypothetical protein
LYIQGVKQDIGIFPALGIANIFEVGARSDALLAAGGIYVCG